MSYKPGAEVMSFEQLAAAVDQAVKRGIPTTMHNVTVAGFRQGVQVGVNSLAHLPVDTELVDADALRLSDSHTYIEPILSVSYSMSYSIKGSQFYGHPEIQRLDRCRDETYQAIIQDIWLPEMLATRKGMNDALNKGEMKVFGIVDISEPSRYFAKMVPIGWQNLRLLVEHGAASRLGCGNDAGPTNTSTAAIQQELTMFDFVLNHKNQAFTAADLLRTATIQSAQSMDLDAEFGSIQSGKVADLVALDGDPLQDFQMIGKPVQALFMDGELVINRCGLQVVQPNTLTAIH